MGLPDLIHGERRLLNDQVEGLAGITDDDSRAVAEVACVRIDFADWLRSLPTRVRRIAKTLATGERTDETARKFGVSAGRISQLRSELAASWRRFVGDELPKEVMAEAA